MDGTTFKVANALSAATAWPIGPRSSYLDHSVPNYPNGFNRLVSGGILRPVHQLHRRHLNPNFGEMEQMNFPKSSLILQDLALSASAATHADILLVSFVTVAAGTTTNSLSGCENRGAPHRPRTAPVPLLQQGPQLRRLIVSYQDYALQFSSWTGRKVSLLNANEARFEPTRSAS